MTSSTSATSSGSRAAVISSSSRISGFIARARTIAARCCWPPESRSGNSSFLSARPKRVEQLHGARLCLRLRQAERLARRKGDVAHHRHVREEVERLEDDADVAPHAVHVHAAAGDLLPLDPDAAGVDLLEQVDAAQQRRLPGSGGADQAHDLVLRDGQVDAAQDLEVVERLVQALDSERRRRAPSVIGRRRQLPLRSRAASQSTKRASGIVSSRNSSAQPRYGVKLKAPPASICVRRNTSMTPMNETSAVSF